MFRELAELLAPGNSRRKAVAVAARWLSGFERRLKCGNVKAAVLTRPDLLCAAILETSTRPVPGAERMRKAIGKKVFFCPKKPETVTPMMNAIERIIPHSRAKLVAERREMLDRLAIANAAYYHDLPEAIRRLDAAKADGLWPKNPFPTPEMAAANIALMRLTGAHDELNARCGRELEKIEGELRPATESAVNTFLAEMLDDLDATQKKFGTVSEPATRNPMTGKIKQRTATNAEVINARCKAIFEARTVADQELRYVEDPAALPAEFAKLRAGLPHVRNRSSKTMVQRKAQIEARFAPGGNAQADAGARTLKFIFATSDVARDGDRILPGAWQLDNFRKNPVFLFAHDASKPPIGKVTSINKSNGKLT